MKPAAATFVIWLAGSAAAMHAQAQPHEQTEAGYTLRSSTVSSQTIAEETARSHGIEQRPDVAIVNVVVRKAGAPLAEANVAAAVEATARTLVGVVRTIELHPARANGFISYFGSFEHSPGEVLEFTIRARPVGSDRLLTLRYRDTLPPY